MHTVQSKVVASIHGGSSHHRGQSQGTGECIRRHSGRHCLSSAAQRRIGEFIERNISERFTLSDLAEAACMSRFHFARKFRLTFGRSPMEYVLAAKVDLAKQLLVTRCHSIAYVAATLGFCDQSHFTRSFRRVAGCSPRQFIADGHLRLGQG